MELVALNPERGKRVDARHRACCGSIKGPRRHSNLCVDFGDAVAGQGSEMSWWRGKQRQYLGLGGSGMDVKQSVLVANTYSCAVDHQSLKFYAREAD
jgi:hypothetical protein